LIGAGCSSKELYDDFIVMTGGDPIYKDIELTHSFAQFYVILNYVCDREFYAPANTIVIHMEPWVYDNTKDWGVKTWPHWSNPDKKKFLQVRRHLDYLNPAQWTFEIPKQINKIRHDKVIAIISGKVNDVGHINRIEFIHSVERLGLDIIDVYGYKNYHKFKNYKGTIDNKLIIQDYKYLLSVENNREYNYVTEKIWEGFIAGTMCFYDGCPNLSDYVDTRSYIPIDCSKYDESLSTVLRAIQGDAWSQNLEYILDAREKTINKYSIFEIINNVVKDL
jgi:hypothetical protein